MPGRNRATFLTAGLAAVTVGASVGASRAQEAATPTPSLILSFGERLEFSDNPDLVADPEEGGAYFRTDLGLSYLSETEVSSLSMGVDAAGDVGRFGDGQGTDSRLETLASDLAYTWEGARTDLGFGAAYRRSRLDDTEVFDVLLADEFESEDLITSGGYRETTSATFDLALGRDMPLGFQLGLDYLDIGYEDAFDATPRRYYGSEAALQLAVSPVLDLGVVGRVDYEEQDDEEDYENEDRTVALTASYAASPVLALSGELGVTRSETTRTLGGDRTTTTNEGATIGASATLARPDGTIGLAIQSGLDEDSRRNTIQASRFLEYPLGDLSVAVGASQREGGDVAPIAALSYSRDTPRGGVTVSYDRSVSTDEDEDRIRSRLALAYERQINNVASWRASVDYASVESDSGGDGDLEDDNASRLGATLAYQREITQDWGFTTGYRYVQSDSDDEGKSSSNTIFFGVSRDFTILP